MAPDINMIVRQLLKYKVTSNMNEAMHIAESLVQRTQAMSEEDRLFKELLISALTPQEVMSIGSTASVDELKKEITSLREELEALKITVHALKDRPQRSSQSQGDDAQSDPPQATAPKKIGVGYGEARKEYDAESISVEKMFYYGNKR
jgi:hypothetical protein